MTERLIDMDDAKLEEVRALLGTSTTKATVNGALDEVIALGAWRGALLGNAVAAVVIWPVTSSGGRRAAERVPPGRRPRLSPASRNPRSALVSARW